MDESGSFEKGIAANRSETIISTGSLFATLSTSMSSCLASLSWNWKFMNILVSQFLPFCLGMVQFFSPPSSWFSCDLAGSSDPSGKAGPNGRGAFNFSFEMLQGRIVAAPNCFLFANISCHTMEPMEPWPSAGRHLFGLLFGRPQKDGPQPGPLKLAIYSWFSIKNGDFP